MTVRLAVVQHFRQRLRPTAIYTAWQNGYAIGRGIDVYRVEGFTAGWRVESGTWLYLTCSCFKHRMVAELRVHGAEQDSTQHDSTRHYEFDYHDPGFPESAITTILGHCDKRFVPRSAV